MRRARLEVVYQGANISAELGRDLMSFTFSEKADAKADEISFVLADPGRLWQAEWAVNHGDMLRPRVFFENWFMPGDYFLLDCGEFEVDEDELSCSGSGDTVTIKALPAAVKSSLSAERKRLASEQGCRLRVAMGRLVIYQGKDADAAPPLLLRREDGGSMSARRGKCEVYKAAVLTYTDAATGKTMKYTATLDHAPATAKTLNLNKKVEDAAQAQRVAFAELRKKNAQGRTATFQGMAQPLARAGGVAELAGWGAYDGLYSIAEAELTLRADGAAESRLSLQAALEY